MQYYVPGSPYFAGDCMPFFHAGIFHLFYLRDENHHHALDGLGGHQWEHVSSADLIHWQHHPLALGIDADWEKSICTGSVFFHDGVFFAHYATRHGNWQEKLCVATSHDCIHFDKSPANPFMSPPAGYHANHFRDPFVFTQDGEFHMLVTASFNAADAYGRGGCLAHLVSRDLQQWDLREPFLIPGYTGVPECPDYFKWNGWYYLLFSIDGIARYRMSRAPFGPWQCPLVDTFDGPMARVMKTAAFSRDGHDERRIGAAFLTSVRDHRDDGDWLYAGNVIFRELVQHPDGTLGTSFVPEMLPPPSPLQCTLTALTTGASVEAERVWLRAPQSYEEVMVAPLPRNARIVLRATPQGPTARYGVAVRGSAEYAQRYEINLLPDERRVDVRTPKSGAFDERGGHTLHGVAGLDNTVMLDIVLHDDILDLCIDGRHCLVNRLPELPGDRLYLYCHNGEVLFDKIALA